MKKPTSLAPVDAFQKSRRTTSAVLPLGALAAGVGLGCLVAPVYAQTATEPTSRAQAEATLAPVKVKAQAETSGKSTYQAVDSRIGKGQQELRDIPQSITVVTEKLIDDRNLDTLKDALRNTAGISFQAAEGGEEDIRLRGFSLQATGDIFIDGLRDPAFYERDTFNNDRVEVLRGSASMLFGRGSTGGAVNQVSKEPTIYKGHEVAITGGSGNYRRLGGDFNLRVGENAALRINAMSTEADNNGVKVRKKGIAPSVRLGIGTSDELLASLYDLDNDNGIHYGLPWITPGASGGNRLWNTDPQNYYGMKSDYSAGGTTYGTLSHLHRFGTNQGELKTTFRAGSYERDQRASAIRFAPAAQQPGGRAVTSDTFGPDSVLTRGTNLKIQDMDTRYLQSDYSGKFQWGGLAHSVQSGVDLAHEEFRNFAATLPTGVVLTKPVTRVGTPDDGATVDEAQRLTSVNRTFDAKALGIYFQDLVQIAPKWKMLAGLRWDRFEGQYTNVAVAQNTANPCSVAPATQLSRTDSLWSKRFGVLYQPTALSSYHFSYGTSFNTSGDTYQFDAGNAKVAPESSRNLELGAKLDSASGNLSTRAALFHTTKYNERNRDADSVNACNYVLSGQRHAAGLELDVSGRITPAWEVYLSYAFIPDAEVDKASAAAPAGETVGARPGLTPKHTGTVWTTYKITPQWRIGGGLNLRSSDTPQGITAFKAPGFATADLLVEYTMKDVSFKFNVTNITDKHYADTLYRGHYVPGKPRTLQLTMAAKF
ncbi:MAG: TonB-dependent siderophore receptor [Rhizobacter sp.]